MKKLLLILILGLTFTSLGCSSKSNKVIFNVVNPEAIDNNKNENPVVYVAQKSLDSVVEVITKITVTTGFVTYTEEGAGSGVILSSDGYIATNHHVIDNASNITVKLSNGNEYNAKVIGDDKVTDLAVIKIDEDNLKPVVFGCSSNLLVGELAVAIGNPLGQLGGTVTSGIISALDRNIIIDDEIMTLLQTNAEISPGNSGGGLFNSRGELIGIVNAKSTGTNVEGIGFAIPIDTALPILTEIVEKGYVSGRANFGASLTLINNNVYVTSVEKSKDAYNAGLMKNDIIVKINGQSVKSVFDVNQIIRESKIGDKLNLLIIRNYNEEANLVLTITEYKK